MEQFKTENLPNFLEDIAATYLIFGSEFRVISFKSITYHSKMMPICFSKLSQKALADLTPENCWIIGAIYCTSLRTGIFAFPWCSAIDDVKSSGLTSTLTLRAQRRALHLLVSLVRDMKSGQRQCQNKNPRTGFWIQQT